MSTMTIEPVRRSVGVDCGVEEAFRIFTREIGSWWPTGSHSIHGDEVGEVVWEERAGGEVYELSKNGEKAHWGKVLAWEPPDRFVLAWHVNPERAVTELEVRFVPFEDGQGTRVELEHRGWDDPELREGYHTGWEVVLGRYAESCVRSA